MQTSNLFTLKRVSKLDDVSVILDYVKALNLSSQPESAFCQIMDQLLQQEDSVVGCLRRAISLNDKTVSSKAQSFFTLMIGKLDKERVDQAQWLPYQPALEHFAFSLMSVDISSKVLTEAAIGAGLRLIYQQYETGVTWTPVGNENPQSQLSYLEGLYRVTNMDVARFLACYMLERCYSLATLEAQEEQKRKTDFWRDSILSTINKQCEQTSSTKIEVTVELEEYILRSLKCVLDIPYARESIQYNSKFVKNILQQCSTAWRFMASEQQKSDHPSSKVYSQARAAFALVAAHAWQYLEEPGLLRKFQLLDLLPKAKDWETPDTPEDTKRALSALQPYDSLSLLENKNMDMKSGSGYAFTELVRAIAAKIQTEETDCAELKTIALTLFTQSAITLSLMSDKNQHMRVGRYQVARDITVQSCLSVLAKGIKEDQDGLLQRVPRNLDAILTMILDAVLGFAARRNAGIVFETHAVLWSAGLTAQAELLRQKVQVQGTIQCIDALETLLVEFIYHYPSIDSYLRRASDKALRDVFYSLYTSTIHPLHHVYSQYLERLLDRVLPLLLSLTLSGLPMKGEPQEDINYGTLYTCQGSPYSSCVRIFGVEEQPFLLNSRLRVIQTENEYPETDYLGLWLQLLGSTCKLYYKAYTKKGMMELSPEQDVETEVYNINSTEDDVESNTEGNNSNTTNTLSTMIANRTLLLIQTLLDGLSLTSEEEQENTSTELVSTASITNSLNTQPLDTASSTSNTSNNGNEQLVGSGDTCIMNSLVRWFRALLLGTQSNLAVHILPAAGSSEGVDTAVTLCKAVCRKQGEIQQVLEDKQQKEDIQAIYQLIALIFYTGQEDTEEWTRLRDVQYSKIQAQRNQAYLLGALQSLPAKLVLHSSEFIVKQLQEDQQHQACLSAAIAWMEKNHASVGELFWYRTGGYQLQAVSSKSQHSDMLIDNGDTAEESNAFVAELQNAQEDVLIDTAPSRNSQAGLARRAMLLLGARTVFQAEEKQITESTKAITVMQRVPCGQQLVQIRLDHQFTLLPVLLKDTDPAVRAQSVELFGIAVRFVVLHRDTLHLTVPVTQQLLQCITEEGQVLDTLQPILAQIYREKKISVADSPLINAQVLQLAGTSPVGAVLLGVLLQQVCFSGNANNESPELKTTLQSQASSQIVAFCREQSKLAVTLWREVVNVESMSADDRNKQHRDVLRDQLQQPKVSPEALHIIAQCFAAGLWEYNEDAKATDEYSNVKTYSQLIDWGIQQLVGSKVARRARLQPMLLSLGSMDSENTRNAVGVTQLRLCKRAGATEKSMFAILTRQFPSIPFPDMLLQLLHCPYSPSFKDTEEDQLLTQEWLQMMTLHFELAILLLSYVIELYSSEPLYVEGVLKLITRIILANLYLVLEQCRLPLYSGFDISSIIPAHVLAQCPYISACGASALKLLALFYTTNVTVNNKIFAVSVTSPSMKHQDVISKMREKPCMYPTQYKQEAYDQAMKHASAISTLLVIDPKLACLALQYGASAVDVSLYLAQPEFHTELNRALADLKNLPSTKEHFDLALQRIVAPLDAVQLPTAQMAARMLQFMPDKTEAIAALGLVSYFLPQYGVLAPAVPMHVDSYQPEYIEYLVGRQFNAQKLLNLSNKDCILDISHSNPDVEAALLRVVVSSPYQVRFWCQNMQSLSLHNTVARMTVLRTLTTQLDKLPLFLSIFLQKPQLLDPLTTVAVPLDTVVMQHPLLKKIPASALKQVYTLTPSLRSIQSNAELNDAPGNALSLLTALLHAEGAKLASLGAAAAMHRQSRAQKRRSATGTMVSLSTFSMEIEKYDVEVPIQPSMLGDSVENMYKEALLRSVCVLYTIWDALSSVQPRICTDYHIPRTRTSIPDLPHLGWSADMQQLVTHFPDVYLKDWAAEDTTRPYIVIFTPLDQALLSLLDASLVVHKTASPLLHRQCSASLGNVLLRGVMQHHNRAVLQQSVTIAAYALASLEPLLGTKEDVEVYTMLFQAIVEAARLLHHNNTDPVLISIVKSALSISKSMLVLIAIFPVLYPQRKQFVVEINDVFRYIHRGSSIASTSRLYVNLCLLQGYVHQQPSKMSVYLLECGLRFYTSPNSDQTRSNKTVATQFFSHALTWLHPAYLFPVLARYKCMGDNPKNHPRFQSLIETLFCASAAKLCMITCIVFIYDWFKPDTIFDQPVPLVHPRCVCSQRNCRTITDMSTEAAVKAENILTLWVRLCQKYYLDEPIPDPSTEAAILYNANHAAATLALESRALGKMPISMDQVISMFKKSKENNEKPRRVPLLSCLRSKKNDVDIYFHNLQKCILKEDSFTPRYFPVAQEHLGAAGHVWEMSQRRYKENRASLKLTELISKNREQAGVTSTLSTLSLSSQEEEEEEEVHDVVDVQDLRIIQPVRYLDHFSCELWSQSLQVRLDMCSSRGRYDVFLLLANTLWRMLEHEQAQGAWTAIRMFVMSSKELFQATQLTSEQWEATGADRKIDPAFLNSQGQVVAPSGTLLGDSKATMQCNVSILLLCVMKFLAKQQHLGFHYLLQEVLVALTSIFSALIAKTVLVDSIFRNGVKEFADMLVDISLDCGSSTYAPRTVRKNIYLICRFLKSIECIMVYPLRKLVQQSQFTAQEATGREKASIEKPKLYCVQVFLRVLFADETTNLPSEQELLELIGAAVKCTITIKDIKGEEGPSAVANLVKAYHLAVHGDKRKTEEQSRMITAELGRAAHTEKRGTTDRGSILAKLLHRILYSNPQADQYDLFNSIPENDQPLGRVHHYVSCGSFLYTQCCNTKGNTQNRKNSILSKCLMLCFRNKHTELDKILLKIGGAPKRDKGAKVDHKNNLPCSASTLVALMLLLQTAIADAVQGGRQEHADVYIDVVTLLVAPAVKSSKNTKQKHQYLRMLDNLLASTDPMSVQAVAVFTALLSMADDTSLSVRLKIISILSTDNFGATPFERLRLIFHRYCNPAIVNAKQELSFTSSWVTGLCVYLLLSFPQSDLITSNSSTTPEYRPLRQIVPADKHGVYRFAKSAVKFHKGADIDFLASLSPNDSMSLDPWSISVDLDEEQRGVWEKASYYSTERYLAAEEKYQLPDAEFMKWRLQHKLERLEGRKNVGEIHKVHLIHQSTSCSEGLVGTITMPQFLQPLIRQCTQHAGFAAETLTQQLLALQRDISMREHVKSLYTQVHKLYKNTDMHRNQVFITICMDIFASLYADGLVILKDHFQLSLDEIQNLAKISLSLNIAFQGAFQIEEHLSILRNKQFSLTADSSGSLRRVQSQNQDMTEEIALEMTKCKPLLSDLYIHMQYPDLAENLECLGAALSYQRMVSNNTWGSSMNNHDSINNSNNHIISHLTTTLGHVKDVIPVGEELWRLRGIQCITPSKMAIAWRNLANNSVNLKHAVLCEKEPTLALLGCLSSKQEYLCYDKPEAVDTDILVNKPLQLLLAKQRDAFYKMIENPANTVSSNVELHNTLNVVLHGLVKADAELRKMNARHASSEYSAAERLQGMDTALPLSIVTGEKLGAQSLQLQVRPKLQYNLALAVASETNTVVTATTAVLPCNLSAETVSSWGQIDVSVHELRQYIKNTINTNDEGVHSVHTSLLRLQARSHQVYKWCKALVLSALKLQFPIQNRNTHNIHVVSFLADYYPTIVQSLVSVQEVVSYVKQVIAYLGYVAALESNRIGNGALTPLLQEHLNKWEQHQSALVDLQKGVTGKDIEDVDLEEGQEVLAAEVALADFALYTEKYFKELVEYIPPTSEAQAEYTPSGVVDLISNQIQLLKNKFLRDQEDTHNFLIDRSSADSIVNKQYAQKNKSRVSFVTLRFQEDIALALEKIAEYCDKCISFGSCDNRAETLEKQYAPSDRAQEGSAKKVRITTVCTKMDMLGVLFQSEDIALFQTLRSNALQHALEVRTLQSSMFVGKIDTLVQQKVQKEPNMVENNEGETTEEETQDLVARQSVLNVNAPRLALLCRQSTMIDGSNTDFTMASRYNDVFDGTLVNTSFWAECIDESNARLQSNSLLMKYVHQLRKLYDAPNTSFHKEHAQNREVVLGNLIHMYCTALQRGDQGAHKCLPLIVEILQPQDIYPSALKVQQASMGGVAAWLFQLWMPQINAWQKETGNAHGIAQGMLQRLAVEYPHAVVLDVIRLRREAEGSRNKESLGQLADVWNTLGVRLGVNVRDSYSDLVVALGYCRMPGIVRNTIGRQKGVNVQVKFAEYQKDREPRFAVSTEQYNLAGSGSALDTWEPKMSMLCVWFRNFPSNILEVPGQYHGLHCPTPETHPKITAVQDKVRVLASLRKPFKIVMLSRLENHPFLLKAGEDLQADQRIEQVFSICNEQQKRYNRTSGYGVRTFSVCALSNDLGLLQWMDNTKILKSVIEDGDLAKKLSLADNEHKALVVKNNEGNKVAFGWMHKMKVSELPTLRSQAEQQFTHARIQPVLRMFLLHQAKHGKSGTSCERFFHLRDAMSKSMATMSVYTYLVTLGDRHLGNIMVDERTAEVIPIDFGHNFGVGISRIAVPELVPFRFTPQMQCVCAPQDNSGTNIKRHFKSVYGTLSSHSTQVLQCLYIFVNDPDSDRKHHQAKVGNSPDMRREPLTITQQKLNLIHPIFPLKHFLAQNQSMKGLDAKQMHPRDTAEEVARMAWIICENMNPAQDNRSLIQNHARKPRTQDEIVDALFTLATDKVLLAAIFHGWKPLW